MKIILIISDQILEARKIPISIESLFARYMDIVRTVCVTSLNFVGICGIKLPLAARSRDVELQRNDGGLARYSPWW